MAEQTHAPDAVVAYLQATWTDEHTGRQRHIEGLREAFQRNPDHVVQTYLKLVSATLQRPELERRDHLWTDLRLREAQVLLEAVPALRPRHEAELMRLVARLHLREGKAERAMPEMEAAMNAALQHDDFRTAGMIMEEVAEAALFQGQPERAAHCNEVALQNFTLAGDQDGATRCQQRAARLRG
jgi:hypothetical protein